MTVSGSARAAGEKAVRARRAAALKPPPVYVLPTRFGGAFVLVALLTLVGCINYLLSLGYALTFLLLSVWVVCAVHASRVPGGAEVDLQLPERAFAGEPVAVAVTLTLPVSAEAAVGVRLGRAVSWLDPDAGKAAGTVILPALPRGPHHLPTLRLEGHDPLALWRSSSYPERGPGGQPLPTTLLVLPAPEVGAPPPPAVQQRGQAENGQRGGGDEELHSLREYRPGDAPRRIAWKQAARQDTLLSRVYDAPLATDLALNWEATAPAGDSEARLSRLCGWVLEAERRNAAFSLSLPGARLDLASGEAQVRRALELLARHGLSELGPLTRRRWPWTRPEDSSKSKSPEERRPVAGRARP